MNQLKLGVLLFGIVGVIGVFLPQTEFAGHSISLWDAHSAPTSEGGGIHVYMIIAGYAVAAVMAGLAVVAPPMQRWHSIVALVAFVAVLLKLRYVLPFDIFKQALGGKLLGVAAYGGTLVSALSLFKPEEPR